MGSGRVSIAAGLACALLASACSVAERLVPGEGLRETRTYRISGDETLLEVARKFRLGYVEVLAANPGVDPWLPGRGTKIELPMVHLAPDADRNGIVINLADMRLYYFGDGSERPRSYPIGIGRDGLGTPIGKTAIVRKAENPTWYPTARMRREDPELPAAVAAGPKNPLGTRALYLGWPNYLVHGTNKPYGVGRRVSSGCIRMYTDDVEELFDLVAVGTPVRVVDQPVKIGWIDGELYVEAHPTQQQSDALATGSAAKASVAKDLLARVRTLAGPDVSRVDWDLLRTAAREHRGIPVRVTR
jgi:L,D-transpeptidase ErfK/SrfK